VDNTFVIWPHGPGKLSEFLDHLNSIHDSIHFTMETEKHSQLPFIYINIHRKPDGSLGHKGYRKPMHTNLYINPNTHRHLSDKQAILSTLVELWKSGTLRVITTF
jgi:hypothetical protein